MDQTKKPRDDFPAGVIAYVVVFVFIVYSIISGHWHF